MKKILIGCCLLLSIFAARADGLDGEKIVFFGNAAGERVAVGLVNFTPAGEGKWKFKFTLDPQRFEEYFLSMAPFRCMQTPKRSLCHFPYGKRDEVSSNDWSALEYQLLFMHKPPPALSINSRNGMMWKLHREGDKLVGKLFDADMEPIIVPSGNNINPLTPEFLQAADLGSHPLPELVIE
ncbi:MAG TPA: hypothetical protein VI279_00770 [Rhodocyclaceae bacterium]